MEVKIKLSNDISRLWHTSLKTYQTPNDFKLKLREIHKKIGDRAITDHGLGFYRDAYVAGEFAKFKQAYKVSLCPEEFPDFKSLTWS